MPILTAEVFYTMRVFPSGEVIDASNLPPATRAFALYGQALQEQERPRAGELELAVTTDARVNVGRWIVDCPFCRSAQIGSPDDPRFLCAECGNAPIQGAFAAVVYPDESLRLEIEEALLARPDPNTREWAPPEPIVQLLDENLERGIVT